MVVVVAVGSVAVAVLAGQVGLHAMDGVGVGEWAAPMCEGRWG